MAINKVVLHNDDGTERTLVDLTNDTVTPQTLLLGATAHNKTGAPIVGVASGLKPEQTYNKTYTENGTYPITPEAGKVISGGTVNVNVQGGPPIATINIQVYFSERYDMPVLFYIDENGTPQVKKGVSNFILKTPANSFFAVSTYFYDYSQSDPADYSAIFTEGGENAVFADGMNWNPHLNGTTPTQPPFKPIICALNGTISGTVEIRYNTR